jgi:hypothetical protein
MHFGVPIDHEQRESWVVLHALVYQGSNRACVASAASTGADRDPIIDRDDLTISRLDRSID